MVGRQRADMRGREGSTKIAEEWEHKSLRVSLLNLQEMLR